MSRAEHRCKGGVALIARQDIYQDATLTLHKVHAYDAVLLQQNRQASTSVGIAVLRSSASIQLVGLSHTCLANCKPTWPELTKICMQTHLAVRAWTTIPSGQSECAELIMRACSSVKGPGSISLQNQPAFCHGRLEQESEDTYRAGHRSLPRLGARLTGLRTVPAYFFTRPL